MKRYLDSISQARLPTSAIKSLPDEESANLCYLALAELYGCVQRLLSTNIQLHILGTTTLKDCQVFYPNVEVVNMIYSGPDTTLTQGRRLMVDTHVRHGSADSLTANYNPQFILDVAKRSVATLDAWKKSGELSFKDLVAIDYSCVSILA